MSPFSRKKVYGDEGVGKEHIPCPAFQQADPVFYLNGGAVFDDLFFVLQHRPPSV
jgi:hypothetical protein